MFMSVTYTENLQLGLQEDKSDTLNWDVLMDNWLKIDAALSSAIPVPSLSVPSSYGTNFYYAGTATFSEVE